MTIKVKTRDNSAEYFEFGEHEGPVLRIDLSRNGLMASSSGDGTIKIWNLDERKVVKTLTGFDKVKSYETTDVFGELIRMKTGYFETENDQFHSDAFIRAETRQIHGLQQERRNRDCRHIELEREKEAQR